MVQWFQGSLVLAVQLYLMLIDLHTHTRRYSWDSDLTPDELVDLAKQVGLDGVCITEHDFFWDHEQVRELSKRHDFLVLPGVEINTDDGHMLCFGLQGYVYGMHRVLELSEHVRRAGGVMVAAHPYRRQMPWDQEDAEEYEQALTKAAANLAYAECVAMERINGRGNDFENGFAGDVCDRVGLAGTAGSDAHQAHNVGRCATEFLDHISDLDGLIAGLKTGRCRALRLTMGKHVDE